MFVPSSTSASGVSVAVYTLSSPPSTSSPATVPLSAETPPKVNPSGVSLNVNVTTAVSPIARIPSARSSPLSSTCTVGFLVSITTVSLSRPLGWASPGLPARSV